MDTLSIFPRPRKIRIWEPHADDAWLSMSSIINQLYKEGRDVEIITCAISENGWETYFLKEFFPRMRFGLLALPDYHWKFREKDQHLTNDWDKLYTDRYGQLAIYSGALKTFREKAGKVLNFGADESYDVIPLGIQHPWHHVVSNVLAEAIPNPVFYVDMPYGIRKKNQNIVYDKTSEMFKREHSILCKDDVEFKLKVFKQVYKSQYFFFKSLIPSLPEILWQELSE